MTSRIHRVFIALVFGLLSNVSVLAEPPPPMAILQGQIRSFSPNGKYTVTIRDKIVSVVRNSDWKVLGEMSVEGIVSAPAAVLVDDRRLVGLIYVNAQSRKVMELIDFYDAPKVLAKESGKQGRSISFAADGTLSINGISNYYSRIHTFSGIDYYDTTAYSCTIANYLSLAARIDFNLTAAAAKLVEKECGRGAYYPSSAADAATITVNQNDFGIDWSIVYGTNKSHPAHGLKPTEFTSKSGRDAIAGTECYEFDKKGMTRMKGKGFELLFDGTWKVKADDLPQTFDLLQLGKDSGNPWRMAPSGQVVAFYDGSSTRMYGINAITNQHADLEPEMAKKLLENKMIGAMKAEKFADAIAYFQRLKSLNVPLTEGSYHYFAVACEKAGRTIEAKAACHDYIGKFGKDGKYYDKITSILSTL